MLFCMDSAPKQTHREAQCHGFILSAWGQVSLRSAGLLCAALDTLFCQLHTVQASLSCHTLVPVGCVENGAGGAGTPRYARHAQ